VEKCLIFNILQYWKMWADLMIGGVRQGLSVSQIQVAEKEGSDFVVCLGCLACFQ
jgi:hypothetical protein